MVFMKMIKEKINADLLPMKGHYFLWNAGTAPVTSFTSTYARQLGFSSLTVGSLFTVLPVCGLLAKPLFGLLADRLRWQRGLFLAFQAATIVCFFAVQFLPQVPTRVPATLQCGPSLASLHVCAGEVAGRCNPPLALHGADAVCTLSCSTDDGHSSLAEDLCSSGNNTPHCAEELTASSSSSAVGTLERPVRRIIDFVVQVPLENVQQEGSCTQLLVNSSYLNCSEGWRAQCVLRCDAPSLQGLLEAVAEPAHEPTYLYQFWVLAILLALSWVGMAVVVSVGDAICFHKLGEQPGLYGRQRLWGSVGWGTFSLLTGALIDEFSRGQQNKDYTVMFYVVLVMVGLDFCISFRLKHARWEKSQNVLRDVARLLPDLRVVVFILWCIASGFCTGLLWNFLFWHLEDLALARGCEEQQRIKMLQGAVSAVQSFGGELPFLFVSGWLLDKLGHMAAMSVVLAAYGVRFLLYSVLLDPWWCLPIELLHGPTYGLFYATMASYASIVAPPGTGATLQGLVGAIFEGVGASTGSLVGGILYQQGGAFTFRAYGIGALVALCVHAAAHFALARRPRYGVQPADVAGKSSVHA